MEILITNQQKEVPLRPAEILTITRKILLYEGVKRGALSLAFVTDHTIRKLNQEFLGRSYATDVLAFDLRDAREENSRGFLRGDIIISVSTAHRQARVYKTSMRYEIILYIVHGILHLLGYDDHAPQDTTKMRAAEKKLMRHLQPFIPRSYDP